MSKNGALLLNVGPRPDGTIPEQEEQILLDIGRWLHVNGEAIYGTRPWKIFGEGPTQVLSGAFTDTKRSAFTSQDIRFTTRGDVLYALVLAIPEDRHVTIKSLALTVTLFQHEIEKIELLGGGEQQMNWRRDSDGVTIEMPSHYPCEHVFALRITPVKS